MVQPAVLRAYKGTAILCTSLQVRLHSTIFFSLCVDDSTPNSRRALNRRDVSGKNDRKDDDPLLEHEDEGNADLGKIVNLMQ